jgi:hypothetical protein
MADRCIQCGWTIAERNVEVVLRGDVMSDDCETLLLHKGGCPTSMDQLIEEDDGKE